MRVGERLQPARRPSAWERASRLLSTFPIREAMLASAGLALSWRGCRRVLAGPHPYGLRRIILR
jgi:hypothetical protein